MNPPDHATNTPEKMTPEEVVSAVDTCFSGFDELLGNYRLEKIKTIGDAYMIAGGLPVPYSDHAEECVRLGMDMLYHT